MSGHTPGPWVVVHSDTSANKRIGPIGLPVITLEPIFRREGEGRIGLDAYKADYVEQAANAQAIAALPDLLNAAREVLACRQSGSFGSDGQQGFGLLAAAVALADRPGP